MRSRLLGFGSPGAPILRSIGVGRGLIAGSTRNGGLMPDYVRREQRDDQAAEWFAYMRSQIAEGAAHLAEEARCRAADPDHQP